MIKKYILSLTIFLTILTLFAGFVTPKKSYAEVCCDKGGGTCYERGAECITNPNWVFCPSGQPIPNACKVQISPPEQVRITDFGKLFSGAVAFLLLIAFLLAFFYLILGGISWLTSGGDKAGVEAARNKIIAAIIGLIIVAATWALFGLIGGAIGFNILGGFQIPTLF